MDADDARRFCLALFEPGDIVECRAIGQGGQSIWFERDEIADQIPQLQKLNAQGLNIYVGGNPRPAKGKRGDECIEACRSLFVDFDHLPEGVSYLETVKQRIDDGCLPKPTLTVSSGHGVHCYWRLEQPIKPDYWQDLQKRLIATLNTDPVIKNPERIMRLPGFLNTKSLPHMPCEIVELDTSREYDPDILCELMPDFIVHEPPLRDQTPITRDEKPSPLNDLGRAMLYAAKWPGVGEGRRNPEAYKHACELRGFNLGDREIVDILTEWNQQNSPPLPDKEIAAAAKNAQAYAKGEPGQKLNEPPKRAKKAGQKPSQQAGQPLETEPESEVEPSFVVLVQASQVPPQNIEWLWHNKIPLGTISILCGDGGAGKSFITLDITARITNGSFWPDDVDLQYPNPAGSVILVGDEDDPNRVVVPRLKEAGADMDKVYFMQGVQSGDSMLHFDLTQHLLKLQTMINKIGDVRLVVLDPITEYMGKVNANSNNDVRSVLGPVTQMAGRNRICVLGINHLSKRADLSFKYRNLGSTAFTAQSRSVWGVTAEKPPENNEEDEPETIDGFQVTKGIFFPLKSNYCIHPTGLRFKIYGPAGHVEYNSAPFTGDAENQEESETPRLNAAVDWLKDALQYGAVESNDLMELGQKAGFGRNLLFRAKKKIGFKARKRDFDGSWVWELPEEE